MRDVNINKFQQDFIKNMEMDSTDPTEGAQVTFNPMRTKNLENIKPLKMDNESSLRMSFGSDADLDDESLNMEKVMKQEYK